MVATAAVAQGGRAVRGVVLDTKNRPIENANVMAVGADESFKCGKDGNFIITVPTYTREVEASMEGYITETLEIDGSYLMFKLKVDPNYAKVKEQERINAEKREAEVAAAKAKAEEEARIAAEKEAIAKSKAEENARIAAEKAIEAERIAAEKEAIAKAKAEEAARIAAERAVEAERIAKEKEAAANAKAEQKRINDARVAAERAEEARLKSEENARIAKEKAEQVVANKAKREVSEVDNAQHIKGYESMVEFLPGLTYIGGYRFNNYLFCGAGANISSLSPFAHIRVQLLNRRCTPFLALSARYSFLSGRADITSRVGLTYRIKPKLGIYCAMECLIFPDSFAGLSFNLGVSF